MHPIKKFLAQQISFLCKGYFVLRYGKCITWGKNILINHRFKFSGQGRLEISDNVNLWAHEEPNRFQTFDKNAEISIGKNCRINGGFFQCREKIEVGDSCMIGSAHLMDTDFHHADPTKRNDTKNIPTKKIVIGKNVWIAGQSAILKGVEIGKNSVVGFRSVVAKNVPENSVVAGNPAKVIKTLSS